MAGVGAADAVVANLDGQNPFVVRGEKLDDVRVRVLGDVGERLGGDVVGGGLYRRRQPLVEELVRARRVRDPLEVLTARERDVLALMAEGRSNTGIAHSLWIAEGTVEKHVRNIFQKLQLPDAPDDHRRVLAVIAFLGSK